MYNENDNPYNNFLGIMREQGEINNPVPFLIGEVKTANPLTVAIGDFVLERKDLKINKFLLKNYQRRLNLATTGATGVTMTKSGGGGDDAFASHAHDQNTIGIPAGTYTTLDDFAVGDEVLILVSADKQQYIIVCTLL